MQRVQNILVAFLVFRLQTLLAPLLFFVSRTWRGRFHALVAGIGGIAITSFLVFLLYGHFAGVPAARIPFLITLVSCPLALVCVILSIVFRRPAVLGTGRVDSLFPYELAKPNQNLSDGWDDIEDEYVWLLVQLVTRLDPWMPALERARTRETIRRLLAEIYTSPDYDRLPRVGWRLGVVLRNGRSDPQHCYTYRPEPRQPGERFGLFVFLHGHGTNYLVLLHALRPLADRMRLVLVAPSFGYGNWEAPGGVEAIDRATRFGLAAFEVDPGRVFLAGLSQGGAGVGRAAAAAPDRYAGLVFLSATMEVSVLGSEAFATGWKGKPVLVIQGERDHNVTPRSVAAGVELMEAAGVKVTMHSDPESGHFLFFAMIDEVECHIAGWIDRVATGCGMRSDEANASSA